MPPHCFTRTIFKDYSVEQLLPSCVWSTNPPHLVALAMGHQPEDLLRALDVDGPGAEQNLAAASTKLQILGAQTTRSIIAGFTLITSMLRMVAFSLNATSEHRTNVLEGREPPLDDVSERVVRLCGHTSDVTNVSLARFGRHIFPVFEDPLAIRYTYSPRTHAQTRARACTRLMRTRAPMPTSPTLAHTYTYTHTCAHPPADTNTHIQISREEAFYGRARRSVLASQTGPLWQPTRVGTSGAVREMAGANQCRKGPVHHGGEGHAQPGPRNP